jgi:hypothetical protein
MAYIRTEEVKQKRDALKACPELKDFKLSVTRRHMSSIDVHIMSGPVDFGTTYQQVNRYYIKDHWEHNPEAAKVLKTINDIISRDIVDNSDVMTDYFDVSYYAHISIGKWDRPYVKK